MTSPSLGTNGNCIRNLTLLTEYIGCLVFLHSRITTLRCSWILRELSLEQCKLFFIETFREVSYFIAISFLHPSRHFKSTTFYTGACLFVGTKSTFSSGCRVFFCRMFLFLLCQRTRIHLTVFGFPLF